MSSFLVIVVNNITNKRLKFKRCALEHTGRSETHMAVHSFSDFVKQSFSVEVNSFSSSQ